MTTSNMTKRKSPKRLPRNLAGLQPVALGCAALAIATAAHAQQDQGTTTQNPQAQQQDQSQLETVVVTGIRKGIEAAIAVKRNNDGVSEAISAEDIGKLPDTTIADSLARLPGVTTQRTSTGQASTISIRGLGPDFNAYLLNGREQSSTGDSRAVDLSVYPAELIGAATVYKTSDATLPSAGLAGTLDTRLVDPLAFGKRTIAGSYQKVRNNVGLLGTEAGEGHRKSLTYIDQFMDRKIGLAVGYVRYDNNSATQGNDGWGGGNASGTLTDGTAFTNVPLAASVGGGFGYKTDTLTDDRNGLAMILSFKPNAKFNTEFDYYRAKIKTIDQKAQVQMGTGGVNVINATESGGVITKGTFVLPAEDANGPHGLIDRTEAIFDNDTVESFGWRSTYKAAPTWKITTDFSHNSAVRVERDIEAYGGILTADTLTFDTTQGVTPQFTLGNAAAYTNPSTITLRDQTGWSGVAGVPQDGYDKGPTTVDAVSAMRLDFTHDLDEGGMFSSLQFGVNWTNRTKDRTGTEGLIVPATANQYNTIPFPAGSFVATDIGGTGLNMLTFTPSASLWPGAALQSKYNNDILSKSWGVREEVWTGFIKGNIDTEWAGIPVRGNLGLQVVNTTQSSSGYQANVSSSVTLTNPSSGEVSAGTTYTDVLPSLNLTGDLGSGKLLRFGLSKQIARNNMTDMRNSLAISQDTTNHYVNGSAGNPYLKPFKATALDLSFEKYFSNKAYLSSAVFYKKLDSYIAPQTTIENLQALANSVGITSLATGITSWNGPITQTVNGSGGNLRGVEFAGSMPFELLTKYLSGFGASASYSLTSSSVQLPNLIGLNPTQVVPASGSISLPGLSKRNAKAMLYFEKWGFSAFVADNYRSTFVGSVANTTIGGYPTLQTIRGSSWVSAQVGYEIQSGYAKGLAIRFEGNNLNDPVYTQLNGDGSINSQNKTGHQYILMMSYKYQ